MAQILSIIAPQGFQDKEYGDSRAALEAAGHTVITACSERKAVGKFGGRVTADVLLADANPDDYAAIVFIGGPGSPIYFDDPVAHRIANAFMDAGKITAAICAAPSILANAGLLKGKTATCFPSEADNLKAHGARYTGAPLERDGLLITADGPASASLFGEAVAKALR